MLDVRRQALRKARNDRPHWVPQTRPNNKHIVTIAERSLRNHEVLEFVGHEGYYVIFRGTHLRRAIVRNGWSVIIKPFELARVISPMTSARNFANYFMIFIILRSTALR